MVSALPARLALRIGRAAAAAAALALAATQAPAAWFGASAPPEPTHEIKAPYYGDALFYFFQDRYFTSITTMMASQQFDRLVHHDDEAEILRGGMLASYGMTREAGEIFATMVARGATPSVRDRAWFYLAKIRYQRGYLPEAEEALAKVEHKLPPELEEERGLLLAQLLMLRSDYAGAAGALGNLPLKGPGSRYVRYNLGIANLKSGNTKRGTELLDDLGKESAPSEEYRSLRDRANVALGFSALSENRPKDARVYLERVRLQSLQSSKALLGFGWAADAMGDPQLALVPWQELGARDFGETAVLEAQIAVPYAYAKLGAYGQSLQRYETAIAAYERESAELEQSIKAIRNGKLIDTLVEQNPGEEMGWFWKIRDLRRDAARAPSRAGAGAARVPGGAEELPRPALPGAATSTSGATSSRSSRTCWRRGARRSPTGCRSSASASSRSTSTRSSSGARRSRPRSPPAKPRATASPSPTPSRSSCSTSSRRCTASSMRRTPTRRRSRLRDRVRLVGGVLAWQISQDAVGRLWDAKVEMDRIAGDLEEAKKHAAALSAAQREEPLRFERFARRIAAIGPILQVMIPRVAALSREQREEAQDIAIAELTGQQQRIAGYTTQARFALAQLYDRAYGKQDADRCLGQAVSRFARALRRWRSPPRARCRRARCSTAAARPTTSRR